MNQTIEDLRQRMTAAVSAKENKKAAITQSISTAEARVAELTARLNNLDGTETYEAVSAIKNELANQKDYISDLEDKLIIADTCSSEEKSAFISFVADAAAEYKRANEEVRQYLAGINPDILSKFEELTEISRELNRIIGHYKEVFKIRGAEGNYAFCVFSLNQYRNAAYDFSRDAKQHH